jgi:hypothetical protein
MSVRQKKQRARELAAYLNYLSSLTSLFSEVSIYSHACPTTASIRISSDVKGNETLDGRRLDRHVLEVIKREQE